MLSKNVLVIFACLLLPGACWGGNNQDATSPDALISRLRPVQDLWAEGTPPVVVQADLQVPDAKGNVARGNYILNWVSPSKWREEIRLGNYVRVRVGNAKGYWQKSSLNYQPEIIFQLDTLLQLRKSTRVHSTETLGKIKNRESDGIAQQCTEVKQKLGTDRMLCFNRTNGTLLSVEYPEGGRCHPRSLELNTAHLLQFRESLCLTIFER